MRTRTVQVVATTPAPVTAVWDLLADLDTWTEWGLWEEARLETPGERETHGVGSRRFVKLDRMRNHEEVFIFDPPHHLAYFVVEGNMPTRDHRSEVMLREIPTGGTEIHWRASFAAKWLGTGWMLERNLRMLLEDSAKRLATRAHRGASEPAG